MAGSASELAPKRSLRAFSKRIGGPSTFAASDWYQEKILGGIGPDSYAQTHRPPGDLKGGPHVSLFNATFGNFVHRCNSVVPNRDDCGFTLELVQAMSLNYRKEKDRRDAALPLFQAYFSGDDFQITFVRPMNLETDGTILFSDKNNHFMLLNIEFKNESGQGKSDSAMQNLAYFSKFWDAQSADASDFRIASYLVSIVGPTLTVYGAVFLGTEAGIFMDPLTPCLHLLMTPDDRQAMNRLASTLSALKCGLYELSRDYSSQLLQRLPADHRRYPYLSQSNTFSFNYIGSLSRYVFLAVVKSNSGQGNDSPEVGAHVVVKFSPIGHCHEAYLALACYGYSPHVWSSFTLLPWWHVTILDYIDNSEPYVSSPERDSKLRHAVQILKESGFVHGDLRPPNVLIVPDSDEIFIIDFDFAGRPDANDVYPSFLNHTNISWPEGVTDNASLQFSHDDIWVSRLTAEALPLPKRRRSARV